MNDKLKIKFYKIKKEPLSNAMSVFVYIDEVFDSMGNKTCYAPIGQHGAISPNYLNNCEEITKDQYLEASKGIYTPEDYLA